MPARPGALVRAPAPPPSLVLARDYTDTAIAARIRAQELTRVGRGAYVAQDLPPRELALARIAAAHQRLGAEHWFSHESAALLLGLPVWRLPTTIHLRTMTSGGRRPDPSLRRHQGRVRPELVSEVHGLPVTNLTLTAVDCARTLPPLPALVVLDAALGAGMDPAVANGLLGAMPGQRGVRRARALLRYADGGAESAQETAARFFLLRAGFPVPTTQVQVNTRIGTFWSDLGFPRWRLLVEYDGRDKYAGPQALFAEKRRQDAITETGRTIVRLTADDRPTQVVARVRAQAPPFAPIPRPELQ